MVFSGLQKLLVVVNEWFVFLFVKAEEILIPAKSAKSQLLKANAVVARVLPLILWLLGLWCELRHLYPHLYLLCIPGHW